MNRRQARSFRSSLEHLEPRILLSGAEQERNDIPRLASDLEEIPTGLTSPRIYNGTGNLTRADGKADTDHFILSSDTNRTITVTLSGDLLFDGVAPELLNHKRQVVAYSDYVDLNGDRIADVARLEYITADGGDFFIRITGADYNRDLSTSYQLSVQTVADPSNNPVNPTDVSFKRLPSFVMGTRLFGLHVNGSIQSADASRDFFLVQTARKTQVNMIFNSTRLDITKAVVFDLAGNQVARAHPATDYIAGFKSRGQGKYIVMVQRDSTSGAALDYSLQFTAWRNTAIPKPTGGDKAASVFLRPGQLINYLDSNGLPVRVRFTGVRGTAQIIFTRSNANGSDIAHIILRKVHHKSTLTIGAASHLAEVGNISIRGSKSMGTIFGTANIRSIEGQGVGNLQVTGFVGSIDTDFVRNLQVDTLDPGTLYDTEVRRYAVNRHLARFLTETYLS